MSFRYTFLIVLPLCLILHGCNEEPEPLKLTTTIVTEITGKDAKSGGYIYSGVAKTCGVCWSLHQSPTIDDNLTSDGSGNGVFRSTMTNLKPKSLYYIRAYATNESGTSYGEELTFFTIGLEPVVKTKFPSRITRTTAIVTGTVNCNYLSTNVYFDYGYDTIYGMTVPAQDNPKSGHEEIKVFACISELTELSTCHFRIRAENELGMSYGNDIKFSMDGTQGTLTDIDGNVYGTLVINTQTWMTGNLESMNLNNGTLIPNITDPVKWEETITPCYRWINDDIMYKDFGAQYNWYTAETGKICPTGWHVPDRLEWEILGSEDFMKIFTELNLDINWSGRNSEQFWWTSDLETGGAWITAGVINFYRFPYKIVYSVNYRERGGLIRCIKDEFDSAE